ncbi:MAG: spore coat U domain-containing protein [Steroidobacteraceae bacterium]|jgi:spore coat protein U-like protein|nr:spore coat U domain-containing protein [Steroidobacteraceae bacterium]
MNKQIAAPIAAAVLMALSGTAGSAERSTTLNVSATVTTNCAISAGAIDFGVFDGANDVTRTSTIAVRCTNGTPFNVNLSTGNSGDFTARELRSGADALVYNLYTSGTFGTVWGDATGATGRLGGTGGGMGSARNLTVHARLRAQDNQGDFDTGTYTDVVTATVVY